MSGSSRWLPLMLVLLLGTGAWWYWHSMERRSERAPRVSARDSPASVKLSVLGEAPDWGRLERWQETISRDEFERLLMEVFTTGDAWREVMEIGADEAVIRTGVGNEVFRLRFAEKGAEKPVVLDWRLVENLPPAPAGKPLHGLHIAIDPGHIGGEWAKVEERWLVVEGHPPVKEGDMTLQVARMIRPRLEALGAKVSMVRNALEPVTALRPDSLETIAKESADPDSPAALRKFAERLFYRTAEIRARADLVNRKLKPDLVLCLHFNAEAWGNPEKPQLVDRTHFHLLLNGGYTDDEVRLADQRFALLQKLLSGTHREEVRVGSTVAKVFAEQSGLPAYLYPEGSPNAREIPEEPYLWARNLLANRLYECPVIFYEPYVMNSTIDHPRMVAGDYNGFREISGRKVRSIFREYADAVVEGLRVHYETRREAVRVR